MSETKINALRKKYEKGNINLVDLIRYLDPTKNKVLTNLLADEILNNPVLDERNLRNRLEERKNRDLFFDDAEKDIEYFSKNYLHGNMLLFLIDFLERQESFHYYMEQFNKYWNANKFLHSSIADFKTLSDICNEVDRLDFEQFQKKAASSTYKIYDNDIWIILLPLSRKASQIYGAQTKWCTTDKQKEWSFYDYTQNGLLIYIINKQRDAKYAYHKKTKDTDERRPGYTCSQFYNAEDHNVDSLDLKIPFDILAIIRDFCDKNKDKSNSDFPNYDWKGYHKFKEERILLEDSHMGTAQATERPIVADIMENPEEGVTATDNGIDGYRIENNRGEVIGFIPRDAIVNE